MKRNILLLAVALTALPPALVSCGRNRTPPEPIVRTAKIEPARLSSGHHTSIYAGKVQAADEAALSFRVPGVVVRLPCAEGRRVRKGEVIAELDARDYRVQLAATEAEYKQVKAVADRVVELYRRGSATKDEYEKAVYGLEQIAAKYANHQNQLADARLTAPFDGYIRRKIRKEGETVGAGMPVIAMIGHDNWHIEAHLSVRDYARRHDFASFDARVSTSPEQRLSLELLELAPKSNASQLYRAVFRLTDARRAVLAAGMSAEVTIRFLPTPDSVCEIPIEALFERDGNTCVWIFVAPDRPLTARTVRTGEWRNDGYITVIDGLAPGELVVAAGVRSVKEGMKVRPLPPVSKTNIGGLR
ncbi:MAG: efflux RND transporter periplasmic adaptor subunit [Prevotellaceae bacterium]|jgi:RND family efflux transporter MFP subunit|nr:efflux RND transporter periplasmic adaptor subunit [Prevotellaceae bacterium]